MKHTANEALRYLELQGERLPSAYSLVDQLRTKAKELFHREHISDLWALLYGYRYAMILHNISGNSFEASFELFQDWLEQRLGEVSWRNALLTRTGSEEAAFREFFTLLDEYRALPQFR